MTDMKIEQLTDQERRWVRDLWCGEKTLRIIDAHAAGVAALVAQLEAANGLLARTQDGSPKRPRVACSDHVQLDYDIGQHLQRQGWQWDAFQRKWRSPGTAETATWTEYRGREQ